VSLDQYVSAILYDGFGSFGHSSLPQDKAGGQRSVPVQRLAARRVQAMGGQEFWHKRVTPFSAASCSCTSRPLLNLLGARRAGDAVASLAAVAGLVLRAVCWRGRCLLRILLRAGAPAAAACRAAACGYCAQQRAALLCAIAINACGHARLPPPPGKRCGFGAAGGAGAAKRRAGAPPPSAAAAPGSGAGGRRSLGRLAT